MTGCVAINCTNRREEGFRLFLIPTTVERRKKWLQNLRRERWIPTKSSCVCEVHFEDSQFESRRADGWRKLKPNAVPTLFNIPNPPPRIDPLPRKSLYKKPGDKVAATYAQKVAEVPITSEMNIDAVLSKHRVSSKVEVSSSLLKNALSSDNEQIAKMLGCAFYFVNVPNNQ